MFKRFLSLAFALVVAVSAAAQNSVQRYVDSIMRATPQLKNAAVACLVLDGRGRTVAEYNPDLPLLSASTMKTVTTGAALIALRPGFQFETKLASAGEIDPDGVLHGDIYIIGGGDPTLGSRCSCANDINAVFGEWAAAVKDAGITAVDGIIIGDPGFFPGEMTHDNWCWEDLGASYGSAPCGLSYGENTSYFYVEPGFEEGAPLKISLAGMIYSGMDVRNDATTGAPKTGNKLNYYASDLSPVGRFTGTYACDRKADTITVANRFPALTCAEAFEAYLAAGGIPAKGATIGAAPDTADFLTRTFSPPLIEICRETNFKSNNFFAETIFMNLGLFLKGEASYKSTPEAVEKFISDLGCDTTGLKQDDGSGLSRQNYVTPRFFCNFYRMMQKSDIFAGYFSTLPTPGSEGTLKYVLYNEPASLRDRIHCKSGSMSGVRCYAGYVEAKGGELLTFAILVNNFDCPMREIQPKVEGFLKQLALYDR